VLPTNELTHFAQGAPQFVHFAAQLTHLVVLMPSVVAVVIPMVFAIVMSTVVAMGPSLDFLGQVMEAGCTQIFDGDHQVAHPLFHVTIAFVVVSFAVFTLSLPPKIGDFLLEVTFQSLGFLVSVVLVQFLDSSLLLVGPALDSFPFLVTAIFMVFPVTVLAFLLLMKILHFLCQFAFHVLGFLVSVVLL
jgi:hypothetical protein